jgi:thiol-disulfide isomerase/thioredoxin
MHRSLSALMVIVASILPAASDALNEGQDAPPFRLPLVTGQGAQELSSLRGKVVVIDFWASWCRPCLHALPELDQLQREFGPRIKVLAVSIDDELASARQALGPGPRAFAALHDPGGAIASRYGVDGALPATIVVDQRGKVRFFRRGGNVDARRLRRSVVDRGFAVPERPGPRPAVTSLPTTVPPATGRGWSGLRPRLRRVSWPGIPLVSRSRSRYILNQAYIVSCIDPVVVDSGSAREDARRCHGASGRLSMSLRRQHRWCSGPRASC